MDAIILEKIKKTVDEMKLILKQDKDNNLKTTEKEHERSKKSKDI